MPQQPNLLLDFNPSPQGGPFQSMLTEQLRPQETPVTGWGGPAANTFMLASRFLEGMQQGKVQKFITEEHQNAQKLQALQAYVTNEMQDLTEADRQQLGREYALVLSQMTQTGTGTQKRQEGRKAKQAETGKQPGLLGHVGNILGDVLTGMAGGNVPQHTGKGAKGGDPVNDFIAQHELRKSQSGLAAQSRTAYVEQQWQAGRDAVNKLKPEERTKDNISRVTDEMGMRIMSQAPEHYKPFREAMDAMGLSTMGEKFADIDRYVSDPAQRQELKNAALGMHPHFQRKIWYSPDGSQQKEVNYRPDTAEFFDDYGTRVFKPEGWREGTESRAPDQTIKSSDKQVWVNQKDPQSEPQVVYFKNGQYRDAQSLEVTHVKPGYIPAPANYALPPRPQAPPDMVRAKLQVEEMFDRLRKGTTEQKDKQYAAIDQMQAAHDLDPTKGLDKKEADRRRAIIQKNFATTAAWYDERYNNLQRMIEGRQPKPIDPELSNRVAVANNNPLNIKEPGSTGQIREFDSIERGWETGLAQLRRKLDGIGARWAGRKLETLSDLIDDWSPKGDGANDPEAVTAIIAAKMGVKPGTKLSSLKGRDEELARLIAWREGYKDWESLGKTPTPPGMRPHATTIGGAKQPPNTTKVFDMSQLP